MHNLAQHGVEQLEKLYARLHAARHKLATVGVCVLAAWVLFHVVFGPNGIMVYQQKKSEYRKVEQQIQQLQTENDALTQRNKALRTDPTAIEKEAREQLRYAKPGEVVYLMPGQKRSDNPPRNAEAKK